MGHGKHGKTRTPRNVGRKQRQARSSLFGWLLGSVGQGHENMLQRPMPKRTRAAAKHTLLWSWQRRQGNTEKQAGSLYNKAAGKTKANWPTRTQLQTPSQPVGSRKQGTLQDLPAMCAKSLTTSVSLTQKRRNNPNTTADHLRQVSHHIRVEGAQVRHRPKQAVPALGRCVVRVLVAALNVRHLAVVDDDGHVRPLLHGDGVHPRIQKIWRHGWV